MKKVVHIINFIVNLLLIAFFSFITIFLVYNYFINIDRQTETVILIFSVIISLFFSIFFLKKHIKQGFKNFPKLFYIKTILFGIFLYVIVYVIPNPGFPNMKKETKIAKALYDLDKLISAIVRYNLLENKKLEKLKDLGKKYQYIKVPEKDPWGNSYLIFNTDIVCKKHGSHKIKMHGVYSFGPDKKNNTSDDIKNFYTAPICKLKK